MRGRIAKKGAAGAIVTGLIVGAMVWLAAPAGAAARIPAAEKARALNAEASAAAAGTAQSAQYREYQSVANAVAAADAAAAARTAQSAQYQALVDALNGGAALPVMAPAAPIAQSASASTAGYKMAIGILSALLAVSIALALTTARRRPRAAIA